MVRRRKILRSRSDQRGVRPHASERVLLDRGSLNLIFVCISACFLGCGDRWVCFDCCVLVIAVEGSFEVTCSGRIRRYRREERRGREREDGSEDAMDASLPPV